MFVHINPCSLLFLTFLVIVYQFDYIVKIKNIYKYMNVALNVVLAFEHYERRARIICLYVYEG